MKRTWIFTGLMDDGRYESLGEYSGVDLAYAKALCKDDWPDALQLFAELKRE